MRRFKHNLSHYHLFTGEMGQLIPAACVEVLPGDTFRGHTSLLVRCQPMVAPVMHPVSVRIHSFFVPNRIIWDGWEKFIVDAEGATAPPTIEKSSAPQLADFLGLPQNAGDKVSRLPFDAYWKIFDEYYRDQEIDPEGTSGEVRNIRWEKDYLTGARPEPQRGDYAYALVVDENQVPASNIRKALAEQKFAEARSRYGNRYVEYLQYLGVKTSDARLQRPEYIGGGSAMISFSEVLQTVDEPTDPLGKLGGHGIASVRTPSFQRYFEEHGWFMTLVSIRPKAIYVNGKQKKFERKVWSDYFQKELQFQGQEAVQSHEVFSDGSAEDEETFGFADRYYSYMSELSRVSRQFRTTFDYWHLGRKFSSRPALNGTFIGCVPSKRIFADQTTDPLLFACQNRLVARRMVARNPTPRTV